MNFPNGFKENTSIPVGGDAAAFCTSNKKQYRPSTNRKEAQKHFGDPIPNTLGAIMERSQENPSSNATAWFIQQRASSSDSGPSRSARSSRMKVLT